MITIKRPEVFRIQPINWGADQSWYLDSWQRQAGCGPVACTNLIWYLARTRQNLSVLWPDEQNNRNNLLRLMETIWNYVTPTYMGVNQTSILGDGARRFAAESGIELTPDYLDIPAAVKARPKEDEVKAFLTRALSDDVPVAFLNLSNGKLRNLESWHWVTIRSFDPKWMTAGILDQGRKYEIDFGLWLRSTLAGGGLVTLREG